MIADDEQPAPAPAPSAAAPAPAGARPPHRTFAQRASDFFAGYFWIILKNVIGWTLMLSSLPVGIALPGPGGIPLFLIGFALVTFPGKRKLTARVMRGRTLQLEAGPFIALATFFSLLVTGVVIWVLVSKFGGLIDQYSIKPVQVILLCVLAGLVAWLVTRLALRVLNLVLRAMPKARRYARPWLRKKGFHLLPPRRRRNILFQEAAAAGLAVPHADAGNDEEILVIDPEHHRRLRRAWQFAKPWLHRAVSLGLTILIVLWILKPIQDQWPDVSGRILGISPVRFVVASAMFAVFLFAFRAMSWRRIVAAFGHPLPVPAAARIWSISELARYLPGSIWQVVGRVHLIKPYGVSGSVSSTAQILEIFVFLLANVMFAVACLMWFGTKLPPNVQPWLYALGILIPLLGVVLHPRVFYGVVNRIMAMLGKPPIQQRLSGRGLVKLLGWCVLGLLWQSLAVWVITSDALELPLSKWWLVGGAYAFAWCVGFLAVWAPGGIGVREVAFMAALRVALPTLPQHIQANFADDAKFIAFIAFVSLLLRLWATLGELGLAGLTLVLDYRGALNDPDAPGRVPLTTPASATTQAKTPELHSVQSV
jgi:hypothetical protein